MENRKKKKKPQSASFFFSILNEKCEECDTGKKEGGKGKNDEGIKELVSFRGEKGEFKLSLSELEEKKKTSHLDFKTAG